MTTYSSTAATMPVEDPTEDNETAEGETVEEGGKDPRRAQAARDRRPGGGERPRVLPRPRGRCYARAPTGADLARDVVGVQAVARRPALPHRHRAP